MTATTQHKKTFVSHLLWLWRTLVMSEKTTLIISTCNSGKKKSLKDLLLYSINLNMVNKNVRHICICRSNNVEHTGKWWLKENPVLYWNNGPKTIIWKCDYSRQQQDATYFHLVENKIACNNDNHQYQYIF